MKKSTQGIERRTRGRDTESDVVEVNGLLAHGTGLGKILE